MYFPFITKRQKGGARGGASSGASGGAQSAGSSFGSSSSAGRSDGSSGVSSGSGAGGKTGSTGSGGGNAGGRTGSSGSGSSGSNSGGPSSGGRSIPVTSGGTSTTAKAYGPGGAQVSKIPSGAPFAGRPVGGGTRAQVYGSRQYGSGYPGITGRGVSGRGFPFVFWPVVWGGAGLGTGAYIYNSTIEYGTPDNSSRPGGPMTTAVLQSSNTTQPPFRLFSDKDTINSLLVDLTTNRSANLQNSSALTSSPYKFFAGVLPMPEQVVQYYRASSVALTLDSYNNSATFAPDGTADSALPSSFDEALLACLNSTIGAAVPLVGFETTSATSAHIPLSTVIYSDGSKATCLPLNSLTGVIGLLYIMVFLF